MTCSLIITTYNWKEALELSILSALNQSETPDEIIIADDGSREDTRELVQKYIESSSIPIIHSWQEDDGFRLSRSRNVAISKSKSEYIIVVDGDMILDKNFVKDHKACAKKGIYLQGSRVLMSEEISAPIIKSRKFKEPSIFSDKVKNKHNMIYAPAFTKLLCKKTTQKLKSVRGCNFSLFKRDIVKVNGFNEDFTTWGKEDSEFVARLYNVGMRRKNLKFAGIQYHIYHKEGSADDANIQLLNNTINKNLKWCDNGIDKYQ